MLWLSLHLPHLPLEVFGCEPGTEPLAVAYRQLIQLAGPVALAAGVRPGMKTSAAQALCAGLILQERRPDLERRALERLAAWCLQFTPMASLEPPDTLLLEIESSLRYFGGLDRLLKNVRTGLEELGYRHLFGIAPTPLAAWLLSRAGDEAPLPGGRSLDRHLGRLPVGLLTLDERQRDALSGLGVETLGDCLALPRTGLARRLGTDLLQRLDRAFGRTPDPREPFRPPPRFHSRIELPAEAAHTDQLGFALGRLIRELCGFLRGTGNGVQRLHIALEHRYGSATGLELGTVQPGRDPARLTALLQERMERVRLPEPVLAVTLKALRLHRLDGQPMHLLEDDPARNTDHWHALLERLSARLGEPRIRGIGTHPEHRPERAWRYAAPGESAGTEALPDRPLWLFPEPRHLETSDSQPLWHGPLILEHGPECIESGWWDGEDVSRDYYVAVNPAGARLWVFRERRSPRRWFLHGLFG